MVSEREKPAPVQVAEQNDVSAVDRMFPPIPDGREMLTLLTRLAERGRREGLLAMEEELPRLNRQLPVDRLLWRGLQLIFDGTDPAVVEDHLRARQASFDTGVSCAWSVWYAMLAFLVNSAGTPLLAPTVLKASLMDGHPLVGMLEEALTPFARAVQSLSANEMDASGLDRLPTEFRNNRFTEATLRCVFDKDIRAAGLAPILLQNHWPAYIGAQKAVWDVAIEGVIAIQGGESPRLLQDGIRGVLWSEDNYGHRLRGFPEGEDSDAAPV